MTRLAEIRARVAEAQTHSARNDPLFSDLEYTLAVIQELTDERDEWRKQVGIGRDKRTGSPASGVEAVTDLKKGQRVKMTPEAIRQFPNATHTGVVTGFLGDHAIRVKRDGRKSIETWHCSYWTAALEDGK